MQPFTSNSFHKLHIRTFVYPTGSLGWPIPTKTPTLLVGRVAIAQQKVLEPDAGTEIHVSILNKRGQVGASLGAQQCFLYGDQGLFILYILFYYGIDLFLFRLYNISSEFTMMKVQPNFKTEKLKISTSAQQPEPQYLLKYYFKFIMKKARNKVSKYKHYR